jgi:hypothetical protein
MTPTLMITRLLVTPNSELACEIHGGTAITRPTTHDDQTDQLRIEVQQPRPSTKTAAI